MREDKSFIEKILFFLFPTWLLNTTPWIDLWKEQQNKKFLKVSRLAMWTFGIGYGLHYFIVDLPLGLTQKSNVWFYYRFGILFLSLFSVGVSYLKEPYNLKLSRIMFLITCSVAAWAQAKSMVWYSGVSSTWSFFISIVCTIFYVSESAINILFLTFLLFLQWPSFVESNQNINLLMGSVVVSYFIVFLNLKNRVEEVETFYITQKQIETERNLSEVQQSLSDQIKAFLPSQVNTKIQNLLRNGYTVTQAVNEVLRPRETNVIVLFSDIRGFTQASKDQNFINTFAFPSIRHCTSIIEEMGGVPRLIGDLIFAYFESEEVSADKVLDTAFEIMNTNELHNSNNLNLDLGFNRFVVLDFGMATCGNLGGINSSREITALGTPVNRASRIDELTKALVKGKYIPTGGIIMTESFIEQLTIKLNTQVLNLKEYGLKVRDFPEESQLYFIRFQKENTQNNEERKAV